MTNNTEYIQRHETVYGRILLYFYINYTLCMLYINIMSIILLYTKYTIYNYYIILHYVYY